MYPIWGSWGWGLAYNYVWPRHRYKGPKGRFGRAYWRRARMRAWFQLFTLPVAGRRNVGLGPIGYQWSGLPVHNPNALGVP